MQLSVLHGVVEKLIQRETQGLTSFAEKWLTRVNGAVRVDFDHKLFQLPFYRPFRSIKLTYNLIRACWIQFLIIVASTQRHCDAYWRLVTSVPLYFSNWVSLTPRSPLTVMLWRFFNVPPNKKSLYQGS